MTSKTLMNLQTSQTWMKLQVTLLFLVPQPLTKKREQKVQVKTTSVKHLRLCFLLFISLHYKYLKIWRKFFEVNIPLECKFLLSRVEKEKIHEEGNLCESHPEEKARWVFNTEVHSFNWLCQSLFCPWSWTRIFWCKLQRKDYPWHTDTVIAVSRYSREHWDTQYTGEQRGKLDRKSRERIYRKKICKTYIILTYTNL